MSSSVVFSVSRHKGNPVNHESDILEIYSNALYNDNLYYNFILWMSIRNVYLNSNSISLNIRTTTLHCLSSKILINIMVSLSHEFLNKKLFKKGLVHKTWDCLWQMFMKTFNNKRLQSGHIDKTVCIRWWHEWQLTHFFL